ncbi:hypothetical protein [Symbiobacterium terraclitae]|uniref:hypothetical protein n=1 Tax=Symbiobacterium terraclitae TaxID=557451 RepID=UPI0035B5466A
MLEKALRLIGFRARKDEHREPDHHALMRAALQRVENARQMFREARTLEELDLARSALQQAQAEVQHVIRLAKRERGIALMPISETEQAYRRLWDRIKGGYSNAPAGRTTDPSRAEPPAAGG